MGEEKYRLLHPDSFKLQTVCFAIGIKSIKDDLEIVIDDGSGYPKNFKVEVKDRTTAFDVLKEKAEELNFNLKYEMYDIGVFIKSIDGVKNGDQGKYWLYYINGEMPTLAADKITVKGGDGIEFKFEKSPF